jgi:fatty acid-binding protein DegV
MEDLVKEYGAKKIQWFYTGCVISTHIGPGGFGIAGMALI